MSQIPSKNTTFRSYSNAFPPIKKFTLTRFSPQFCCDIHQRKNTSPFRFVKFCYFQPIDHRRQWQGRDWRAEDVHAAAPSVVSLSETAATSTIPNLAKLIKQSISHMRLMLWQRSDKKQPRAKNPFSHYDLASLTVNYKCFFLSSSFLHFYRTRVHMGSDHWVAMSLCPSNTFFETLWRPSEESQCCQCYEDLANED